MVAPSGTSLPWRLGGLGVVVLAATGALVAVLSTVPTVAPAYGDSPCIRGDANADGRVDVADAVRTLLHLFRETTDIPCLEAADADATDELDTRDAVFTLTYLSLGAAQRPAFLGPSIPLHDRVKDPLSCAEPRGRYPWPFSPPMDPKPVFNCFHTVRFLDVHSTFGAYFHGGIDIRMPVGTPILSVAEGTVEVYREGRFDNVVLTEPNGDVWEYRHVQVDSSPPELRAEDESQRTVQIGAVLGVVPHWGAGVGEAAHSPSSIHHIHLNRRSRDGCILNPLESLLPVRDGTPPRVQGIHFLADGSDIPYRVEHDGVVQVSGKVDIVVDAIDFMEGAEFGNPPLSASWRVQEQGTWHRFEPFKKRLPERCRRPVPRYPREGVEAVYLLSGPLRCINPAPLREPQTFSMIITNVDSDGAPSSHGSWSTSELDDGEYTVEVVALDSSGNRAVATTRVRLLNHATRGAGYR